MFINELNAIGFGDTFIKKSFNFHKGLTRIKSEDHPAEIHLQEGFNQFNKTCHQKDQRPTNYGEPHVQVKVEKVQSDECNSSSEETRKWVVCGGGLLKEVLKVDHTDWSVETSKDSSENIDQKEQHNDETVSEISVTHKNVEPYITTKCTKQFMQSNHPNSHEQINIGEKQHTCTSNTYSILKPNQRLHTCMKLYPDSRNTGVKPNTCGRCGESFTTFISLKIHKTIHAHLSHIGVSHTDVSRTDVCYAGVSHTGVGFTGVSHTGVGFTGGKLYSCSTCGKLFTQSHNLKVHEKIHTGVSQTGVRHTGVSQTNVKLYSCSICGKSFTKSSDCKVHEMFHADVKVYTCGTCEKSFKSFSSLKTHERIHIGVKLNTCSRCGKSFTTSVYCKIHERLHTGVEPHACSTCGKLFRHFSSLKIHEQVHTGVAVCNH